MHFLKILSNQKANNPECDTKAAERHLLEVSVLLFASTQHHIQLVLNRTPRSDL